MHMHMHMHMSMTMWWAGGTTDEPLYTWRGNGMTAWTALLSLTNLREIQKRTRGGPPSSRLHPPALALLHRWGRRGAPQHLGRLLALQLGEQRGVLLLN